MMTIRKRTAAGAPERLNDLDALRQAGWACVDLSAAVADTQVREVWVVPECIGSIRAWVGLSLEQHPVPETGGFLLGRMSGQAPFSVSLEVFVPSRSIDYSSPNRLSFGAGALMELDTARREYPGLAPVGWFHTHPGHTPYLSSYDLAIHEGFFIEPWQLAVVLDPLTPGQDTGIFSRKADGSVNNKPDWPAWISWTALLTPDAA
jgi:proteasome lid subunit RPN8/RPN11